MRRLRFDSLYHRCVLCTQAMPSADLCADCTRTLQPIGIHCPTCASALADPTFPCGQCLSHPRSYEALYIAYRYGGAVREVLLRAKYRRERAALRLLSRWACILADTLPDTIEFVVPMPISYRRLIQRGFNQTHFLATSVANTLGVRCAKAALIKENRTPQSALTNDAVRRRNIGGAFRLGYQRISGHVLLVDDVFTSGATAGAAALALKTGGAQRVSVLVIAARQS